ncbi:hypothetical protein ACHAW5_000878 [Stephanodiscus triporus]|uniref:SPX domain-containing protein n=1 Tax=Stephanodiscus triporus TaxID=2934178 RepID=A0ABD3PTU7_9STRA
MKFCRNLQRVIDITDPEWAPYWTNYKMLKKFLKALVPPDAAESHMVGGEPPRSESPTSDVSESSFGDAHDNDGDNVIDGNIDNNGSDEKRDDSPPQEEKKEPVAAPSRVSDACASSAAQMSRHPGEIAFFKLLNSELKKAIHFFDKAQLELEIREARVREGIDIMRKANSLMVSEKWSLMAKSLYRLYKDLLLLETYAIMTYCSFSKILKKHDKATSHCTRVPFMKNVVNKANFAHYPKLMGMITRCEILYDEVSQSLIQEGKSGLYEDERLFINMIHRLNEQVLDTAEGEGAPDVEGRKEKKRSGFDSCQVASPRTPLSSQSPVTTLRSLVQENALNQSSKKGLALVAESEQAADAQVDDDKCPAHTVAEEQAAIDRATLSAEGGEGPVSKTYVQPSAKRARLSDYSD